MYFFQRDREKSRIILGGSMICGLGHFKEEFMQNISVYLNPRASNGERDWQGQINQALFKSVIDYPVSNNLEELYKNLDRDVEKNVDAILSVGGDGTAHTIIQKIAGTDIGLLVVPGGTANDLARVMGSCSNIKKITKTITHNTRKKIDLVEINGTFMATNGGLGFAGEVALEINELRKKHPYFKKLMQLSGKNIYSLFAAKRMLGREIGSYIFKIESPEYNDIVESPMVLINNQPMFGGSFEVAPYTNHQDGKFNITIFKHSNRLEFIACLLSIINGRFSGNDKNVVSFETSKAKIELLDGADELSFFGDGENLTSANSWEIKCHANFLNVFSPKDHIELDDLNAHQMTKM